MKLIYKLSFLVALLVILASKTTAQQHYSISASSWVINPNSSWIAYPFDGETGFMCFNFPRSPTPDPNAIAPFYAVVVTPTNGSITGTSLTLSYKIKQPRPDVVFNWMNPLDPLPPPGCTAPANVRLYFQSGPMDYNGNGYNRWWSNSLSVTLAPGKFDLTVPLDPSQWSETFGRLGTTNPSAFYNTLANASFIGWTYSGGCTFGHGVSTTGGKDQWQTLDFFTQ